MRSRTSLFFFTIIYNYLFIRAIIFPYFYTYLGNNISGIILLIILTFIIFFLYFVSAKLEDLKKSWVKYILAIFLFFRCAVGLAIGVIIIKRVFFIDYNIGILSIGIIIGTIALAMNSPTDIVELSTPFGLVIGASYIFYSLSNLKFIDREITFMLSNNPIIYLLIFLYVIDNYMLVFSVKERKDKPYCLIGTLTSLVLFLVEYLVLIGSSGTLLFKNDFFSGFVALSISAVSKFDFNFAYIYIVMIIITACFKFSYFLSIIREILGFNKKIFSGILFPLLFAGIIGVYYAYIYNFMLAYYIVIASFSLYLFYMVWVIKNARRV